MIVGPSLVTFLCRNFVLLSGLVCLRNVERTVGAALRGRPRFKSGSRKPKTAILECVFKPRAATEGRPDSTFHVFTSVGFHI